MSGTSTLEVYDASILAVEANLIVTSMQYRFVQCSTAKKLQYSAVKLKYSTVQLKNYSSVQYSKIQNRKVQ